MDTLKQIKYKRLMQANPTHLTSVENCRGQVVRLYEDPWYGEDYNVIGVIEEAAFDTTFKDTGSVCEDYIPVLLEDGTVVMQFQLNLK